MADRLVGKYFTDRMDAQQMGQTVDVLMTQAQDARRGFERRWYDNNFFDDGYHFRYLSRQQNKIVDLADRSTIYNPLRAIPKSSRQIRGMANLLINQQPFPVVYPEKVNSAAFPPVEGIDPQTGQPVEQPNPDYEAAVKLAKQMARLSGHWVQEEFDKQNILEKIALMVILAAKHGVSFMEIWPDPVKEEIRTQVFDAFDVYLVGSLTEISDSPFIIKGQKRVIAEIKADERFDPARVEQISPDNRHASSEIKEAYMKARHGGMVNPEAVASVIEKEYFIKEYLNDSNTGRIRGQEDGEEILKGRTKGDIVIRHGFVAGNVNLRDEYVNLTDYPFVDFRFEPGPIYQVPLIERFIPSNKSLDLVVSRLERYIHTMVTGAWIKRKGEQFDINNTAGGQIIEFAATPPVQAQIANMPNFVFNFMNILTQFMEEQGVTTTALGKIPPGVRANAAIESLKESEYANLAIAVKRLQGTVKRIAEKFLDLADRYFIQPRTSYYLERGEPQYFDVIGASAIEKRNQLKIETPEDVVPLRGGAKVDIQVESGLGYTKEAKKAAARELGEFMIQLAGIGLMNPETVKIYVQKLFDLYGFGMTQDIIESMEQGMTSGQMNENQIMNMKVAMAEVMKDAMPTPDERISEGKIATAETIKDLQKGGQ